MLNRVASYSYATNKKISPVLNASIPLMRIQDNRDLKSLYLPGGVSFKGGLLNTCNTFSYRAKLAQAIGVTTEKLKSILEPDELKAILEKSKPEAFSIGENFENILNGTFRINLHMHTKHSDGVLSVQELLNQAAKYADYRKEILHLNDEIVIGISDHDTVNGSKEAIKMIANNPEKYKNIKFVSGSIEFNTMHNGKQMEAIGYCINPFDNNLNTFLESRRTINQKYFESFLQKQVNQWEANAGIPENQQTTMKTIVEHAKNRNVDCGNHLQYFGSPGLTAGFVNTLKSIFWERGWRFDGIDKFASQHGIKYGSFAINPGTPTLEEVVQIVSSNGGFVGIAHPCRNLGGMDLRYLFQDFKKIGVNAVEANYQYPNDSVRFPKSFQDHAYLATIQNEMLKTGGHDNHTDNIFTNRSMFSNLPETVKSIILSPFKSGKPEEELALTLAS